MKSLANVSLLMHWNALNATGGLTKTCDLLNFVIIAIENTVSFSMVTILACLVWHLAECNGRHRLALQLHLVASLSKGAGAVNNGTVIGWGLARDIFHHHRLVSRHPKREMG